MPLQATSGAASYDGFGGGVAAVPNYIEDVFSTYLYTGDGSTSQAVPNGIDLAGKGGLVWEKARQSGSSPHFLSTSGVTGTLSSNNTSAATGAGVTFGSNGYTLNATYGYWGTGFNIASWTFRKQPKFFDVVTWTGDGTNNRQIPHSLASTPGCVIVKRLNAVTDWLVWHRSSGAGFNAATLNGTGTFGSSGFGPSTAFTDTYFTVANQAETNASGGTFVAYVFAHNAGGFGLTGTDNVISCGSYTGNGTSLQSINLGYEPQLVLIKSASIAGTEWAMLDNMRGVATGGVDAVLNPNTSGAEASPFDRVDFTATGFDLKTSSSIYNETGTYIYIAIRRGPMKVPTSGTSVFGLSARSGTGANATVTGGQTDDAVLVKNRGSAVADLFSSRLTGTGYLVTSSPAAEVAAGTTILQANPWDVMDGVKVGTTSTITNASGNTFVNYLFKRAPSFFDEVCYTGGGSTTYIYNHNLGVAPELIITKNRSTNANASYWAVKALSFIGRKALALNNASEDPISTTYWPTTADTATQFRVVASSTAYDSNATGTTYVAYLFASCPGVSKVGSYTGTGTTLQVDCGFTGGARFVLIKRTDAIGDWYVWDTARGIVAGNDPYLLLDSTAAEVTTTDYIDTYSAGFEISSTAPAAINASGGTFIFLAIA